MASGAWRVRRSVRPTPRRQWDFASAGHGDVPCEDAFRALSAIGLRGPQDTRPPSGQGRTSSTPQQAAPGGATGGGRRSLTQPRRRPGIRCRRTRAIRTPSVDEKNHADTQVPMSDSQRIDTVREPSPARLLPAAHSQLNSGRTSTTSAPAPARRATPSPTSLDGGHDCDRYPRVWSGGPTAVRCRLWRDSVGSPRRDQIHHAAGAPALRLTVPPAIRRSASRNREP